MKAGKVNYNYVKIKGVDIDPGKIMSLDLYESIEYPGVTGSIKINDWESLKETFDVFAGDLVEISFGRKNDPPFKLEYLITDSPNDSPNPSRRDKYITINFCTPWIVTGHTQNRSMSWKNKYIHEIVADLVEMCGGSLGTFATSKQKLERFVSPFWSPIQTIRYLMSFAVDELDNGGHLLWTDMITDKVNFIPYGRLVHKDENYGLVPFKLTLSPGHIESPEYVTDMTMASSFDIIKYGNSGLARSNFVGFNYDRTELMGHDKKIDSYMHNHLSTKLPLNDIFLGSKFRTTKDFLIYPSTNELISGTSEETARMLLDGKLYTKQVLSFSDMLTLHALTLGEGVHKRAGRLVYVNFPATEPKAQKAHKQFAGTYLIKNIRHMLEEFQYTNAVTLVCDGFKSTSRTDMIDWVGENDYDTDLWDITSEG